MHSFWDTIIAPLLEILQPPSIVEIGSSRGTNTYKLLEFCKRQGSILHAIDPLPRFDVAMWQEQYRTHFVYHWSLSLNALAKIDHMDVVLIDGDPNWYTVFQELQLIEKRCAQRSQPFPVVLVHNTGWPYGRRDRYTRLENIPAAYRSSAQRKGVQLESTELQDIGGLYPHRLHSIYEHNFQNGALTAIEDFLEKTEQPLELLTLPGFCGLGLLFSRALKACNKKFAVFIQALDLSPVMTKYIEKLEQARIELAVEQQNHDAQQVCIIIPNKNGAGCLQQLFASFLAHNTYPHVTFMVVDHASSDHSREIICSFASQLSIEVISCRTNYSFAYANNRAAERARAQYLLFLNNDILFQSDVIPTLVNHLQNPYSGVAGVKLMYPGEHPRFPGRPQHWGIKFFEDIPHGFYRPYELGAKSGMDVAPDLPAVFPAASAAVMLCRRDEFLSIGGFCEDYIYGYEDVDLCLTYWAKLGKVSLSANELAVIHNEGYTRRSALHHEVRLRGAQNQAVLRKRYGYAIRAAVRGELISREKFWSDHTPVVAFALAKTFAQSAAGDAAAVLELADMYSGEYGWEVKVLTDPQHWYDMAGVDVLIVMTESYDLGNIRDMKPTLIKIAWLTDQWQQWGLQSCFDQYEVYLCSSEQHALCLREKYDKAGYVLKPATPAHQAAQVEAIMSDFCNNKFRIAIKVSARAGETVRSTADEFLAIALRKALVRSGHVVRIDRLPDWNTSLTFGDTAVLVLRGAHSYDPQPEQLNVMWNSGDPAEVYREEYERYNHIFVTSQQYADQLRKSISPSISVLPKETDPPSVENYTEMILGVLERLDTGKRLGNPTQVIRRWRQREPSRSPEHNDRITSRQP